MSGSKAAAIGLLLIGLLLCSPRPATSQSGIIVDGADSVRNASATHAPDLTSAIGSVGSRVVSETSRSSWRRDLADVATTLHALFEAITSGVIVEGADSSVPYDLIDPPAGLQTSIDEVSGRIVVEYADSGKVAALVYPLELLDDHRPPQISNVRARRDRVLWATDEFATSNVMYGVQTGVYTETVTDPLYARQHEITLTGLTMGTTYYYRVYSADQSGNVGTSAEHTLSAQIPVYLPLVTRKH
jgi:hypothetical protein